MMASAALFQTRTFSKAHVRFWLTLIVGFYLVNGVVYLRYQTLTSDEGQFYNYTVRFLKGHPERSNPSADNSKMPVVALNTLPRMAERVLHAVQAKDDGGYSDIMNGRYVTLAVSVFTLLLVARWGRDLYGPRGGLVAAFLFSFCPNHLANAGLVTTDAYSVLFLTAVFYFLWRFCVFGRRLDFFWLSVLTGLAQLVKQSLFHLYILVPVCIGLYYVVRGQRPELKRMMVNIVLFLFINWLIINAGFYFYGAGQPLHHYRFMSRLFITVQQALPPWLPVPFPHPFVEGLDQAKYYDQIGGGLPESSFGNVTILGHAGTGRGFWFYFFVALLFKTPIPTLLLFGWAFLRRLRDKNFFSRPVFFLLAPVSYFLLFFSFLYKTQVGVRHIIFVYPFLYLFAAYVAVRLRSAAGKVLVALLCVWQVVSVLSYWKNYYPYTNELIVNKTTAYKTVGAGNLEFLQGGRFLLEYLHQHPNVRMAPRQPQPGRFAISLREYMDVWNLHEYDWIQKYEPSGNIARTYLLINVDSTGHDKR